MARKKLKPIAPVRPIPAEYGISSEEFSLYKKHEEKKVEGYGCLVAIGAGVISFIVSGPIAASDQAFNFWAVFGFVFFIAFIIIFSITGREDVPNSLQEKFNKYKSAVNEYNQDYELYLDHLSIYEKRQEGWWYKLSGWQFEEEFSKLIKERGYNIELTKGSGDGGIDLIARKDGRKIIIQCKKWKNQVGPAPVRELQGVREPEEDAWVVGLGGFTKGAVEFAKQKSIRLIDYGDVADWVEQKYRKKYASEIEQQKIVAIEKRKKKLEAEKEAIIKQQKEKEEESLRREKDEKIKNQAIEEFDSKLSIFFSSKYFEIGKPEQVKVLLKYPKSAELCCEGDAPPLLVGDNFTARFIESTKQDVSNDGLSVTRFTYEVTATRVGNFSIRASSDYSFEIPIELSNSNKLKINSKSNSKSFELEAGKLSLEKKKEREANEEKVQSGCTFLFFGFVAIISMSLMILNIFGTPTAAEETTERASWIENTIGITIVLILWLLVAKAAWNRIKKGSWASLLFLSTFAFLVAFPMSQDEKVVTDKMIFLGVFIFQSLLLLNAATVAYRVSRKNKLKERTT